MPDDFQALPPNLPLLDDAAYPPSGYDRFAQVNLRKAEDEGYDWRWVRFASFCVLIGICLLALTVVLSLAAH
jgi:hypothetical protein